MQRARRQRNWKIMSLHPQQSHSSQVVKDVHNTCQKVKMLKRSSSIHTIEKCQKPGIKRNLTYVDDKIIQSKSNMYPFREKPSENSTIHTNNQSLQRLEPTVEKQSSRVYQNPFLSARDYHRKSSHGYKNEAMKPEQLRHLMMSLKQGSSKLMLRLR